MNGPEPRKQISMFVPRSVYCVIRTEAARRRIPMSELCRRWIKPHIDRLNEDQPEQPAPPG